MLTVNCQCEQSYGLPYGFESKGSTIDGSNLKKICFFLAVFMFCKPHSVIIIPQKKVHLFSYFSGSLLGAFARNGNSVSCYFEL